ncbi:MAG TPA: hypothetical protein DEQ09_07810, partial [Bacteroidales bacterium]|nr:hypothetical protein [Bacteroidales bacterium]
MINLKQICKSIFLAVFFIYAAMPLSAADRYSVSSGNWNSTSTWSASSGGASGASVPIAGDNVYIESNHTITVTANAACANITFTGSGGTLNVNLSVTLTVSGSITLNILETGNTSCTISGSGSVSCANVNTGQAVYTPVQSVLLTHTILSTISSFNVSSDINLNSYKSGPMKRYANFNLQEGILDVSGSIISPGPPPKSTFSMETGAESGTLVLGGATPFNVSGADDILLEGVSTLVNYKREGNQTVLDETYTNLTLSGSGTKTLNGVTVSSILSIEGSAVASGTTPTYGAASTLQYKGSVAQTTGIEFPATFTGSGGVIIDNSNGVSLNSDKTIESNLNLVSGYLNAGSTTLIFQNSNTPIIKTSGTITTNSSTNIFFGTTGNTVGAVFTIPPGTFTSAPIINNLTINRTNSLTLGNQMISVKGIVLCNGPLNTAGNLTLVSDASATALIDGSGTGQITGNVTIQRYLPVGFGYKYFSSPFQSATVNEFGDDMDLTYWFPTFYKYDESRTSSGWVDYTTTTNVLQPMVGYAVNFGSFSVPNTVDVTGTVNNGALSLTLYNNNNTYTQGLN